MWSINFTSIYSRGIRNDDAENVRITLHFGQKILIQHGIIDEGANFSAPVNTVELDSLLRKSGFRLIGIKLKRNPRYFETPAKCLEYVETSSFGNFLGNTLVSVRDNIKAEILAELKKYQTPKGIESVYYDLFALAEKSLDT